MNQGWQGFWSPCGDVVTTALHRVYWVYWVLQALNWTV